MPRPLTSFIGRLRETAAILDLLANPDVRLVTLTGPGGVGKTRLALCVAGSLGTFPDGIWFVPLAPVRYSSLVPLVTAQALGVTPGPTVDAELRAFLGQRRCLVILDNFEHLMDAGVWLAELLQACPRLTALATSRSSLSVSGEHVYKVPPLALPDADDAGDHDRLLAVPSVALFVERARASSFGFTLSSGNARDVAGICRRLDGLPLAIELAATRIASLSLPTLRERIEHQLTILTGGPREAPDRQRTMRDAIAWSHDLLSDPERTLFRRLGVFVNGFTLDAAEAIGDPGADTLETLTSLVASNLVNLAPDDDRGSRYSMLETIREYALQQLARSGEDENVRRGHASYYMSLAEEAIPYYDGPELPKYVRLVLREIDNCRSALGWTLATDEREVAIRLSGALYRVWWNNDSSGGHHWAEQIDEGRRWMAQALERRNGLPVEVLTETLVGAEAYARLEGDLAQARAWGEELLHRADAADYVYGWFFGLLALGNAAIAEDKLELGAGSYTQALALAPLIRDPDNQASIVLLRLGRAAEREGRLELAETCLQKGLGHCRKSGNPYISAVIKSKLGRVVRNRGKLTEATSLLTESLAWFIDEHDTMEQNAILTDLAVVSHLVGLEDEAVHLLSAASSLPVFNDNIATIADAVTKVQSAVDAALFDHAWREGQEMSWDEVMAEVDSLNECVLHGQVVPKSRPDSLAMLTPREVDVLRLLMEGRANRTIADALSLSERSVENHVRHILDKLDLDTRTAAATYAVRHGLG